jgi:2-polyprenyl-3-methyl-5-hydroxy-6-metoxy-1,4-benzoquinol methylase
MNKDLYRMFFEIQKKHWWFVAKKEIVLDVIRKYAPKKKELKILDVGCGSGLMLNSLEKIGKVFGMDMHDDALAFSREIFSGQIEKGFLPANIPYPKDTFDLVMLLDVIEHVEEDVDSLKSIREHMSVGGKAVITVPATMLLWSDHDVVNEHKRRYSYRELKSKLLSVGFHIEKISYYNTLLFPIVLAIRMVHYVTRRKGKSDMDLPNPVLNFLLKNIFAFEKYILRIFNMPPWGVSLIAVVRK